VKDQTYFLCLLEQRQLEMCRFPLGPYFKTQVREMARDWALPTRDRPDSQGICFLGRIPFSDFVRRSLGEREGEIRLQDTGRVLGKHRGHWFYTLGQRQGLGLSGGPFFVVAKDPATNVVEVVHGDDLDPVAPRTFLVASPHWVAGSPPGLEEGLEMEVKVRHSPRSVPCRLSRAGRDSLRVELEEADSGIAPGQFAVFYQGHLCLGGGAVASIPRTISDPASSVPS
jgi:tRNA-specific 2-thiouridylase